MTTERHAGRPLGSSAGSHIRVAVSNKGSWRLTIGKELWRGIGSPVRVSLDRRGNMLHIAPADDEEGYAVSGGSTLNAPRISIGSRIAYDEFGLTCRVYESCFIRGGEIVMSL